MNDVQTNLVGQFVKIPSEGDRGWVRAVWRGQYGDLRIAVQRDNPSRDVKTYTVQQLVIPEDEG